MAAANQPERRNGSSKPKEEEEEEEEASSMQGRFTLEEGSLVPSIPLVLQQNFWFDPELLKSVQLVRARFVPRPDDTILATFPKCGTTWLKALAFAITSRSRHTFARHPLLTRHPPDVVPFLELPNWQIRPAAELEAIPSPRLLATHMPLSLLPESVTTVGCRLVYVCREPKDAFVSKWHFENKVSKQLFVELGQSFHLFCEGVSFAGPIWDHYLEYWNESKARPGKVLFLKYEEMTANPVKEVKRLADFLGHPFTDEEEGSGVVDQVVRLCSFENLTSLEVNSTGVADRIGGFPMENSTYFRRGNVGDWVNYLSREMAQQLDGIVEEKLKGSGLTL
ncbi:cytosolic sulfotransferase 8-like [Phragmites australis]|uniref:cytosolic sulfotransferase 8-like n=1 Tax=Phragmites australis TaxID=29695 RepID=UPI002D797A77|nr:cytosolic sulfotransferase 8-like [Phragmites australis]